MKLRGTYDIECADWDRFVVGATYEPHNPKVWHDPDLMIDHMRSRGGTWWAHAGGVYDVLLVGERLRARGIKYQGDEAQHRITRLVCGSLEARDSYALFPAPLDELCGLLGREVPSLPWPCVCTLDCGGYCQIARKAAEGDPDLEDYCVADCKALYDGLVALGEHCERHGIDLRGTLGSTAWATAQAALGLPDAEFPSLDLWRRVRRADKGGRLAIVRPKARGPGSHFDIRNAYPSALARAELPVGGVRELGAGNASHALDAASPGVYSVTVEVADDCFLPPLPWRVADRVVYPTGRFSGAWALPELCAALDRGVRLVEVSSAIVWESTAPLFADLVRDWYAIRRKVGADSPLGQWQSRLMKALCGKLAEGPEKNRILVNPDKIRICVREKGCRNGCTGRCRRYEQIDLWGHIWSAPYWKLAPSGHVQWSAYLRAHTRIQWITEAEKFGADVVYGNTDSLWTLGRKLPSPIGDDLGHWERKHGFTDWECRAPNVYRYRDDTGQLSIRAAGAPQITEADWQRGQGVNARGVTSFRRAARSTGSLFQKKHRRWTLAAEPDDGMYGDRKLGADGITYPLPADQWRALSQADKLNRRKGSNAARETV